MRYSPHPLDSDDDDDDDGYGTAYMAHSAFVDRVEALDLTITIAQEEKVELYVEIGQTMRKYRTAAGVSLREMARRLKCSAPLLSDMEHGNRYYSVKWRIKAFAALYTPPTQLCQTYTKTRL